MRRARRPRRVRVRRTRVTPVSSVAVPEDAERLFRQLLHLEQLVERKEMIRKQLLKIAEEIGEIDDRGSQSVELTTPLTVGKATYRGFVRRRKVSTTLDVDKVRKLAEEKGISHLVFRQVVIEELDQDELYACQQRGLISEADLEACISTHISYALEKLK